MDSSVLSSFLSVSIGVSEISIWRILDGACERSGRWDDRGDLRTLDVKAAEEGRPEELGLELGNDASGRDDGVEVGVLLGGLAVDSPGGR